MKIVKCCFKNEIKSFKKKKKKDPAVVAQIFHPIAELVIPIVIPTK